MMYVYIGILPSDNDVQGLRDRGGERGDEPI